MTAIRYIRREIFKVTQSEFAALVGVGQATVSRWESGVAPSLDDMQAIRSAASERGIEWQDRWFFEPATHEPATPVSEPEVAE
ncbi:helix-turn-helix domain-containing protein [Aquamicrobium sp.]|uniref:helix-turn-helix domain-containing protein n=1 Tax=Aquamicrobium sp. TaxID=1872579 RepID=UPI00349E4F10